MAYSVDSLPQYIEQHADELVGKTVLNAKTLKYINIQTGCKGKTALNNAIADIIFQDGSTCGYSDMGNVSISQRYFEPHYIKVNMNLCPKDLKDKYLNTEVVVAAKGQNLPAEEAIVNEIVAAINNKIDTQIWAGENTEGQIKGFYHTIAEDTIAVNVAKGTTATEWMKKIYMAIPADVIDGGKEVAIFVPNSVYREYVMENNDTYHEPASYGEGWVYLKGTNVKIIGLVGLDAIKTQYGQEKAYAGNTDNFYFGTDMVGDAETFELFFDNSDRVFKFVCEFNGDTQVRFPDKIVNSTREA